MLWIGSRGAFFQTTSYQVSPLFIGHFHWFAWLLTEKDHTLRIKWKYVYIYIKYVYIYIEYQDTLIHISLDVIKTWQEIYV